MDRFFGRVEGSKAVVEGNEFHHFRVKRIKPGDTVQVLNENNQPYLCKVRSVGKKHAELEILKELPKKEPKVSITLYQCVPVKVSTFDDIVEMVSQTGVDRIVPVISKRSFQKLSTIEEKITRWKKIARESLKQSGRDKPLTIEPPKVLKELTSVTGLKLFPFERASRNICTFLEKVSEKEASLIIGPEGGFSKEEADFLTLHGWNSVSLGDFILKAPTAAAVATGILYNALIKNHFQ